jgi:hypothetical protein
MKSFCIALLCAVAAHVSQAAPILTVAPTGIDSGNRVWDVKIAQDVVPGALAAELAFAIDGADLLSVVVGDATIWDTPLPGNNPYTGTETEGIYIDLINDRSFAAYGSAIVNSMAPTHFLRITTAGLGATSLRYGTIASPMPNQGNIIANSQGIHRYSGTAVIPEPASAALMLLGSIACAFSLRRRVI